MCIYENQGKLATEDIVKRVTRWLEGLFESSTSVRSVTLWQEYAGFTHDVW
jgi:hypothetical protein